MFAKLKEVFRSQRSYCFASATASVLIAQFLDNIEIYNFFSELLLCVPDSFKIDIIRHTPTCAYTHTHRKQITTTKK